MNLDGHRTLSVLEIWTRSSQDEWFGRTIRAGSTAMSRPGRSTSLLRRGRLHHELR